MEDAKKELKSVLSALSKGLETENELNNGKAARDILDSLVSSPYDFTNPDIFNTMFMFPLEQLLELVTKSLHAEKKENVKDTYKPQFIFMYYGFLKSNIEKLIEKKRKTSSCVADVSRTILSMYLNYSLTGEIPKTNKEEHFYLPKFGENEDWINFCDGLYKLFYGNNELYLTSYSKLISSEIRKYPHIKYSLVAKMVTGEEIVVEERFDNSDINKDVNAMFPIDRLHELVEEGFIVSKRAFPKKKDYLLATHLGDILNRFYYKVPKCDVLDFSIKEQSVML